MLPHVVLAPSSTVFLFSSTKTLIISIFSMKEYQCPCYKHTEEYENMNDIFTRRNQTFLLFESEEGERVGSGMKLAMIAKNITPPKNCQHSQCKINYDNKPKMDHLRRSWFYIILKKDANPKIPLQEANGINSIMSQIKERYAQHQTSSKTLYIRIMTINMCSRL